MDKLSRAARSENMRRIRGRDTGPERIVRSALHQAGFRFRLHPPQLPGRPDIILPKYRTVVFVNGCFWHRHSGCADATMPKTRRNFWFNKLEQNRLRDHRNAKRLRRMGFKVVTVWECETARFDNLSHRLRSAILRHE